MFYRRSLEIERRLEAVLGMIRRGAYSTPQIAKKLGVSIPTVSRDVTALRQRGYDIKAERGENGWRYRLASDSRGSRKHHAKPLARRPASGEGR